MRFLTAGKKHRRDGDEIESPPCPVCGEQFLLLTNMRDIHVRTHNHFTPHIEDLRYAEGNNLTSDFELVTEKRRAWTESCDALILKARDAARTAKQKPKLSPEEIRAAQSRGGKNQSIAAKRAGGENQSFEDKARGGQIAMHNRWHVRRGVRSAGCELCALLVDSGPIVGTPTTT